MVEIRKMIQTDIEEVLEMMRVFYASPAVLSNGSEEIFRNDIENCVGDCPFLEGYVFSENSFILGYAMVAKSFSTEFGKPCLWVEDLYLKPDYRSLGIGTRFFAFIEQKYSNCIVRLEVEKENLSAIHTYKKSGYEMLDYMEMKKEL